MNIQQAQLLKDCLELLNGHDSYTRNGHNSYELAARIDATLNEPSYTHISGSVAPTWREVLRG